MQIKIGHGANGDIFGELEDVKACNYCRNFKGYGLHACSGHCSKFGKDIEGGYIGAYSETARECGGFEVRPELLEENTNKSED